MARAEIERGQDLLDGPARSPRAAELEGLRGCASRLRTGNRTSSASSARDGRRRSAQARFQRAVHPRCSWNRSEAMAASRSSMMSWMSVLWPNSARAWAYHSFAMVFAAAVVGSENSSSARGSWRRSSSRAWRNAGSVAPTRRSSEAGSRGSSLASSRSRRFISSSSCTSANACPSASVSPCSTAWRSSAQMVGGTSADSGSGRRTALRAPHGRGGDPLPDGLLAPDPLEPVGTSSWRTAST